MITTQLLTKEEAEIFMNRTYQVTKAVPVKLFIDGKPVTYYQVYRQAINNRWYLCTNIKPEWLKK